MTVIQYVVAEATTALETRLLIEDGAKVHLVQICDTDETTTAYSDVAAVLGKESEFSLLQITLGRKEACFGVAADLRGDRSRLVIDSAYIAGQDQKVDINYVARHRGVDTESEIKVNGVLRAGSKKAFRGTIDFIRGCAGSRGDEREDVLLLDEDIVNQTIPLILCQEEDVEGTHGATIGDLSEETLLYFRSRGIPDEEAYRLLADGRMISAIREIPEKKIREKLLERFGETETEDENE
jgi:Fe-S cluster assembly scaffold protein SufB